MEDALINYGGGIEIKSVGSGLSELRGPSVVFDPHEGEIGDFAREYFAADSYFGPSVAPGKTAEFEATFNHGIPSQEGLKTLADYEFTNPVKTEVTDTGLIASLLLDERESYEKMLAEFARDNPGKLGWSTATAPHRAKREAKTNGRVWIKRWPIVEVAVTHTPCEPRTSAVASLKSFAEGLADRWRGKPAKGLLKDKLAAQTPSWWQFQDLLSGVAKDIAMAARAERVTGIGVDISGKVDEALAEYVELVAPHIIAQIEEFAKTDDEYFYLKSRSEAAPDLAFAHYTVVQALKAGRRNSARDLELLNRILRAAKELGATEDEPEPKPNAADTSVKQAPAWLVKSRLQLAELDTTLLGVN
ncbi:MAG TPA: hypothetical protein VF297_05200 [Pyrinomonadaceae bacterium]